MRYDIVSKIWKSTFQITEIVIFDLNCQIFEIVPLWFYNWFVPSDFRHRVEFLKMEIKIELKMDVYG